MWLVVSGRERIGCLSGFRTSLCGQVLFNPNFSERQIARSHGNRFVVNSLVTSNFNCLYVVFFFVAAYKVVLSLYCITIFQYEGVVSTYVAPTLQYEGVSGVWHWFDGSVLLLCSVSVYFVEYYYDL
jgi:membrane protein required for beta-lactamase induction